MAFDDLPLDRPGSSEPPPPFESPEPERSSPVRFIVIGLVAVVAVGLLVFGWLNRSRPAAPESVEPPPVETAAPPRPEAEPLTLPPLADSDTFVRDLVSALSNHPTIARLLARPAIVRSMTIGVVQIADGRTPTEWLQPLRPATRADITGDERGTITPETHARWNQVADAISSIPPRDAAQLYVNLKPLIEQAYEEIGRPDDDFDRTILRAAQVLRSTPEPSSPPVVVRRKGYFEYEDPSLQALRPVQKQLLLLGPENRRRLMAWIDAFLRELGLEPAA